MLETVDNKTSKKAAKIVKLIPNLRVAEEANTKHLRVVRNDFDENVNHKGVYYLPISNTTIKS